MDTLPEPVLNKLYEAFSKEPHPVRIEGCPCCVDEKGIDKLLSTPLRKITPEELGNYASSVFLTVGAEADFRYFLPRILELLVTLSGWWPSPELVGKAMANIPWEEYTPAQRQAIEGYFAAIFQHLFNQLEPDGSEIDSWLCCSSHVLPGWDSLLEDLMVHPKALVALYEWHGQALQRHGLGGGFWESSPKSEVLLHWLLSNQVKTALWTEWGL